MYDRHGPILLCTALLAQVQLTVQNTVLPWEGRSKQLAPCQGRPLPNFRHPLVFALLCFDFRSRKAQRAWVGQTGSASTCLEGGGRGG